MIDLRIAQISTQDEFTKNALLKLNNAHARETSHLTPDKWRSLVDSAFSATCVNGSAAILISFDQDTLYDNANFKWFHDRYSRFIYIDRIIVAGDYHGMGIAKHLYRNLYRLAQQARHELIVCEVNLIPPNPVSDAFHFKMGFSEVGRATLEISSKTVRYLAKNLEANTARI